MQTNQAPSTRGLCGTGLERGQLLQTTLGLCTGTVAIWLPWQEASFLPISKEPMTEKPTPSTSAAIKVGSQRWSCFAQSPRAPEGPQGQPRPRVPQPQLRPNICMLGVGGLEQGFNLFIPSTLLYKLPGRWAVEGSKAPSGQGLGSQSSSPVTTAVVPWLPRTILLYSSPRI